MMIRLLFAFIFLLAPSLSFACASCGCSLSSDWENPAHEGLLLDLRYDFINQNQLRAGTSPISPNAASQLSNPNGPQEVESYTKNQYVTATVEYSINTDWKVDLVMPYIIRTHATLGTASDGTTAGMGGGQYTSSTSSIGDFKLLGRYEGFARDYGIGIIYGLKLPTGAHNLTGTSTDPTVTTPVAIDRGLQPGTGSTDLILGLLYSRALNKNWDYYAELLYQEALTQIDAYRPGDGFNFNLGTKYLGWESWSPQLQINTRFVEHDSGVNADLYSTGGTLVFLSPGAVVPVVSTLELYTFVQIPIYENLLGVQLAPNYTFSIGARYLL